MNSEGPVFTYGFGIAKEYNGKLEMGLYYNPSKNELFTAVRGLGAYLNKHRIHVNQHPLARGVSYDYAYWEGAPLNVQVLNDQLGPPLGSYSAIYQACTVAAGRAAFSVFPGNTLHDVAPGAIIVTEAGGHATDLRGQPHDWRAGIHGAVFSNGISHDTVVELIKG